jgi:hypothetical protein
LGGEKIDVVQWGAEVGTFIANALSPAKVMNVLLDDNPEMGKTGTVIVPDRQLSLAIGKEGQNARLAAKLTGWRIDIKSASEAAEETLGRIEDAEIAPEDMDLLSLAEALLRKRDKDSLSEEEQALISAGLEAGDTADLDWPEQEPAAEAEVLATGAAVGEAEAGQAVEEAEAIAEQPKAPEVVAGEAEAAEPGEKAEAVVDEAEAEPAKVEVPLDEEAELPFEGELIEDSLGWVATESQEDLYDGWGDLEAEALELPVVDSDELWEKEEVPQPTKKRKKRRKDRRAFGSDDQKPFDQRRSTGRGW